MTPSLERTRRLVERVHALGPAPLMHLLLDLDRGAELAPTLERYAALPADFVRALGGDRFATPLRVVDGGRQTVGGRT